MAKRAIQAGPQIPVVVNSIFTPTCGLIPDIDISSATVINPGLLGVIGAVDNVLIQTTSQNIRYTLDGTTPTAAVGFQLKSTDPPLLIALRDKVILTVIEEAATASLMVQFGGGPCESPVILFQSKITGMQPDNLIAYWPLGESAGPTAWDRSGNARNGVYSGSGVTYSQSGIGDGSPSILLDGTNGLVNVYSASFAAAFDPTEGALVGWCKVADVGDWAIGTGPHYLFNFAGSPASTGSLDSGIITLSNALRYERRGSGVNETASIPSAATPEWIFFAAVWSEGDDIFEAYFRNETGPLQSIGTSGLSNWAQPLVSTSVVLGALDTTHPNWSGNLAHVAVWDIRLTSAEILELSRP
jgi:hypothetical protein